MNREPILILSDIIQNCMSLADNQVIIYNQDFDLPTTDGLFIIINYINSKVFSNTNSFIPADEEVPEGQESISMLTKEDYVINIISKNDEARQRKEEVILSLKSNFSQDQQGLYQFQIASISNSFTNVSELEGAGMLNRYAINISLLAHYNKTIETPIYDDFTNQIIED